MAKGLLFDIPKKETKEPEKKQPNIKLKKGQTINDLILAARQIVLEKLGNYKDTSKCVIDVEELKQFFNETQDIIAIDTETTGY